MSSIIRDLRWTNNCYFSNIVITCIKCCGQIPPNYWLCFIQASLTMEFKHCA